MVALPLRVRAETGFVRALLQLPSPVLRRLLGPPIEREGRRLDTQVQLILRARAIAKKKKSYELPLETARREFDIAGNQLALVPPPPLARVEAATVAGRAARIYRPSGTPTPAPALLYLHGGGFVVGSLDSHDGVCRQMAARVPCVVVALDYRLAPEHPFPAAADDATAAFRDLVHRASSLGLDPSRIAVGGDSAGGNLATVVGLDVRRDHARPRALLAIYPVIDFTMSFPSHATLGRGFLLEDADIRWYRAQYIGDDEWENPRASPWAARDLGGLPPSVIVTAGFDPLRDEGDAWSGRLREAGVEVTHLSFPTLFHGFWNCSGGIRAAVEAVEASLAALRRHLS